MAVYKSITFDNRKKIAALYAKGMSISDISDEVGVALRTLYVELKRGATGKLDQNQRPAYDPVSSDRKSGRLRPVLRKPENPCFPSLSAERTDRKEGVFLAG